ncbi:two-component sensor histidine kinase [Pleurocapsa sp. CCALA 161]|uniref:sensor histidine kinase n=1 Tax=Pleurocapsa sp. CCALA 161 TaxID=2107688 RepID=UPI000D04F75E|nr:HAMP domain-containing sensor histidine kinase [Pleurocapsa sp. CCALA 161]PSB12704.1 two-component sensor histidine kinase [Pleurocapsa sp. CCALA 161]
MFHHSRRRLAYWFTISMGGILALFALTLYYIQLREKIRIVDQALYMQSKYVTSKTQYQLQQETWQIEIRDISLQGMKALPLGMEVELAYIRWYDRQGNLLELIGKNTTKQFDAVSKYQTLNPSRSCQSSDRDELVRQLTLPVYYNQVAIGYLQIANSLCSIQKDLAKTQLFLALGVPLTLGLTGLVGWFLGGVAMKPTQKAYEQLQRFTADASHELRAPISAILSNAQVGLLSPADDSNQPRQRLENIVTITKSTSSLISNLLFLARHEGRLNPDDLEAIDLHDLLQSLSSEFQTLATEKNLNFVSDLSPSTVVFKGDRELLQQALKNLINNAYKYTPAGGKVGLTLAIKSRQGIISIEDNGIGIPPDDLPRIFDRFYRVDIARSRETGGFGLGLAIAKQIIQAHNGQITVESSLDKGTKFQIFLPIV